MKHLFLLFTFTLFILFKTDTHAQETLEQYKIEQLQKELDTLKQEKKELQKDIDDVKEKTNENKTNFENIDKRMTYISYVYPSFATLITILLALLGFFAYSKAQDTAKAEAKKTTKDWIEEEGKKQLQSIVDNLEKEAKQKIEEAVQTSKDEIKQQSKAEELFMQGNSNYFSKKYDKAEEYYLKAIEVGNTDALNNLGSLYYDQNEYKKAEKYYLKAIEAGNTKALLNLGLLYSKQEDYYLKAEEYYLKAVEAGVNDALFTLGLLYSEQEEYVKAEEYYLKAIEAGSNKALNNLAHRYFIIAKEPMKALKWVQSSYEKSKEYANTHTFATVLLWNEAFIESYEKFEEWLGHKEALENIKDLSEYLLLLLAKEQYNKAKEYFEDERYQLKEKVKPIWCALLALMKEDLPHECASEEVDETLKTIAEMKEKYKI